MLYRAVAKPIFESLNIPILLCRWKAKVNYNKFEFFLMKADFKFVSKLLQWVFSSPVAVAVHISHLAMVQRPSPCPCPSPWLQLCCAQGKDLTCAPCSLALAGNEGCCAAFFRMDWGIHCILCQLALAVKNLCCVFYLELSGFSFQPWALVKPARLKGPLWLVFSPMEVLNTL